VRVQDGGGPCTEVSSIPSGCEQSFESGITVDDVASGGIEDARRAGVVLQKVNEGQGGQVDGLLVFCAPDGHVGRRQRLFVAAIWSHFRPRPLFRTPVFRHVRHCCTLFPTIGTFCAESVAASI